MSTRFMTILTSAFAAFLAAGIASPAYAVVATGPDDICPPAANPCLIDDHYDVQSPGGFLDFGLREVRIVSGGRIESTATVLSGHFVVDVGPNDFGVNSQQGLDAGTLYRPSAPGLFGRRRHAVPGRRFLRRSRARCVHRG